MDRQRTDKNKITPGLDEAIRQADKIIQEKANAHIVLTAFIETQTLNVHSLKHFTQQLRLNVLPAFTSKDTIVLHFNLTHDGKTERRKFTDHVATHKFGAPYAAKKFIEAVVGDDPTKWTGPNQLTIRAWITASSDDLSSVSLEDIMEHEYSKEEKKFELPHPYIQYALVIGNYHRGTHPEWNTRSPTPAPYVPHKLEPKEAPVERPEPKERKERPAKERSKDAISLADICKPLKIDPREARQALRKSKTPKPDAGWQWSKAEAEAISKLLPSLIAKHVKKGK